LSLEICIRITWFPPGDSAAFPNLKINDFTLALSKEKYFIAVVADL
jgi:hypothetical protein